MRVDALGRTAAGISVGLLLAIWGGVVFIKFLPTLGSVGLTAIMALSVAIGFGVAILTGKKSRRSGERISIATWWPALVAPLLGSLLLLLATSRSTFPIWAMQGDMVWNTAQSLFVHRDGGVLPMTHPNPAPLTNLLFAFAYGPQGVPSLRWVFEAQSLVLIVTAAVTSFLSAMYAVMRSQGLHSFVRCCLAFAVGWLPHAGPLLGALISFGHANALVSYLVLWLAWLVFSEASFTPLIRGALLMVLTTVTMASWAPLAVVPLGLMIVASAEAVGAWRRGIPLRRVDLVAVVLGAVQFIVYAIAVTIPDLGRERGALSQDGASLPLSPVNAAILMGLIGVAAVVVWWMVRKEPDQATSRRIARGVLAILTLSVPALAYLMLQRRGMSSLWGYYPMKYVTLLGIACAGVMIANVAALIPRRMGVWRQILAAFGAVPLFLGAMLAPFAWGVGSSSVAPAIGVVRAPLVASQVEGISRLVTVFDATQGNSLFFDGDVWDEAFSNQYLIQLSAQQSTDPIRAYAYISGRLEAPALCELLSAWGTRISVHGDSDEGAQRLTDCDPDSFELAGDIR